MTTLTDINNDILSGIAKVQSPYLYLQGAGSDGSDGSTDGIHLRWDFLRSLGDTHLPKGNLASGSGATYPAAYGFNKANDYVEIFRVPYFFRYPCVVNFNTDLPTTLVESGPTRQWKFDTVVQSTPAGEHCEVVIQFDNVAQYDTIRATYDPMVSPYNFLAQYTGIIEASVTNKLCFALTGSVKATGSSPQVRMEAISTPENIAGADLFIGCRKVFSGEQGGGGNNGAPPRPIVDNIIELFPAEGKRENKIMAENIVYFRFDYSQCVPVELRLETYEQFILGTANQLQVTGQWQSIGAPGFSLSDQDSVVYNRLEDSTLLNVNQKWPRYLGENQTSGLFTVNVQNYKAKWDPTLAPTNEPNDLNGLRKGVTTYLTLSQQPTNPTAITALPNLDPNDFSAFNISYFQMLKIIALDYHAARMLGMGYIDPSPLTYGGGIGYIYLSVYHTTASLETGDPATPVTHFYMTLPTTRLDYRLPPAPAQDDPGFGITIDNGTGFPVQLTDANGYAPFDDVRIINLKVEPFDVYQAFGPFFTPPTEFCSDDMTKPVFYGVKYKLVSESNYRTPEISNDSEYSDASGVFETAPIIPQLAPDVNSPTPPLYVHEERENGNHEYGIYGINWFSRPSPLSNIKTVNTAIPVRNTLLPPSNFSVQLIQPEDPLILTTSSEQTALAALTGDKTLVRMTFEWNQNHYIPQKFSPTNVYADKAQFYFRQAPPRAVQGEIKSVTPVASTQFVDIRTQSYTNTSSSPPQTISPTVVVGDEPRFIGSFFASNQVLYVVESVTQSTVTGEGAIFRVKKQVLSTTSELSNTNLFSASIEETIPNVGDRFLVTENMNDTANWANTYVTNADNPLTKEVQLINFLESGQLHQEIVTNPDGTQTTFNIGGIFETATITEVLDVYPGGDPNAGNPVPGSRTGLYEIVFDTFQLANHPDVDVEWYKGTARILEDVAFLPNPTDPTGRTTPIRKPLDVWKIDVSGSTLKLTVYDATLDVNASYQPQHAYNPVQTGSSIAVNFHPGYRVYLEAQTSVLDQTTTLPTTPATSPKQTFMASRSENTTVGTKSFLNTPVILQGRFIITPVPPALPAGPLYATRPNFYGKATWTMDVGVTVNSTHEPYAMVFYRANERAILDTLYNATTADSIMTDLEALSIADAAFETNRWRDLVNVQNFYTDFGFNEYTVGGYRFPTPDNTLYKIPGTTISPFNGSNKPGDPGVSFTIGSQSVAIIDVVKQAVQGAFLPLTEVPVIYQFINNGTQTSSRKPTTRNSNGDMLVFTDPAFDPSPMAVKYVDSGNTFVRFTDYTLDGTLLNIYFYYAVEMNDEMKFSAASPIAGPIKLVNAYPAEQPGIRKVTSILADPSKGILPSVKIELNPYVESENIKKVKLYRANNNVDATSIRSMTLATEVNVINSTAIEISDTFEGLPFPLYGDPLFYRIVAMREITNEFVAQEFIPSQPSDPGMAMLADVLNPPAPAITGIIGAVTNSELQNVTLKWGLAAYNGTYYLHQMTAAGNWQSIFQIKTNDENQLLFVLPSNLLKIDADGNTLYYRFRIKVENASGLFNLTDNELTL
jgi:hypothetical protein